MLWDVTKIQKHLKSSSRLNPEVTHAIKNQVAQPKIAYHFLSPVINTNQIKLRQEVSVYVNHGICMYVKTKTSY